MAWEAVGKPLQEKGGGGGLKVKEERKYSSLETNILAINSKTNICSMIYNQL